MIFDVQSPIFIVLLIPALRLITDSFEFFLLFLIKGIRLIIIGICDVELLERPNAIVLEDIAEVVDVIHLAHLLNLIDPLGIVEGDVHAANGEGPSLENLHALFGNIHPGARLRAEVHHMEAFETVEPQLRVLDIQTRPLNL